MDHKRNFFRLDTTEEVTVSLYHIAKEKTDEIWFEQHEDIVVDGRFKIHMKDLSAGGMRAVGMSQVSPDMKAFFEFALHNGETLRLKGVFKACDGYNDGSGRFVYRVQFLNVSQNDEQHLFAFINHLQEEMLKTRDLKAYDAGDTTSITDQIRLKHGERRKGPDLVKRWPPIATLVGEGVLMYIAMCIVASRPMANDALSRLLGARPMVSWNLELLYKAYTGSLFLMLFAFFSMLIDSTRQNRKDDYRSKVLPILAGAGMVLALYFILSLGLGQRGVNK